MKKQKLFKALDIVIYFNVFIFIGAGIQAFNTQMLIFWSFFIIGALNLVFLVITIKLRMHYNKEIEKNIELEVKTESSLNEEKRDLFRKAKQEMLETRIESELIQSFPEMKIIRNAYVPRSDGMDTEVDIIAISELGVFIIESKNITGKIDGLWSQEKMTILHPGGQSYEFQNPINQNTSHYKALKNLLGIKGDLFRSIIVFGDSCTILKYKEIPFHAGICFVNGLVKTIGFFEKKYSTRLKPYEIEDIYQNLLKFTIKTSDREKEHISNLKPQLS